MQTLFTDTRNASQGYTLIELITALAIVMILCGLSVPSLRHFLQQIRLSSATSDLYSAIHLARAEAIKRNGKVDLTAIAGDWKNGWVISSSDNEQIMAHESLHDDITVSAKFSDGTQHISYNGTGRSRSNSSTTQSQSGHIYLSVGDHARSIIVNFLGHVRVCNPATEPSCTLTSTD